MGTSNNGILQPQDVFFHKLPPVQHQNPLKFTLLAPIPKWPLVRSINTNALSTSLWMLARFPLTAWHLANHLPCLHPGEFLGPPHTEAELLDGKPVDWAGKAFCWRRAAWQFGTRLLLKHHHPHSSSSRPKLPLRLASSPHRSGSSVDSRICHCLPFLNSSSSEWKIAFSFGIAYLLCEMEEFVFGMMNL